MALRPFMEQNGPSAVLGNPFDEDVGKWKPCKEIVGASIRQNYFVRADATNCRASAGRRSPSVSRSESTAVPSSSDSAAEHSAPELVRRNSRKDDGNSCAVCRSALGKRHMRPRQQCYMCCLNVCSGCSPSCVQVDGALRRACNTCAGQLYGLPALRERLDNLSKIVATVSGSDQAASLAPSASVSGAIQTLEGAVASLHGLRDAHDASKNQCVDLKARADRAELVKNKMQAELQASRSELDFLRKERELVEHELRRDLEDQRQAVAEAECRLRAADIAVQKANRDREASELQVEKLLGAVRTADSQRKDLERRLTLLKERAASSEKSDLIVRHMVAACSNGSGSWSALTPRRSKRNDRRTREYDAAGRFRGYGSEERCASKLQRECVVM